MNEVISGEEKRGGTPVRQSKCRNFVDCINECKLGQTGPAFTWNNLRHGRTNVLERLDRALCNQEWRVFSRKKSE